MNKRRWTYAAALLAGCALLCGPAAAQDKPQPEKKPTTPPAAERKPQEPAKPGEAKRPETGAEKPSPQEEAWIKYATPGDHHRHLNALVGSWECTGRMWETPAAQAHEFTGTADRKWIMGGRYLEERIAGTGEPFEGFGLLAYDNLKKKYTTVWIDNHSTGVMVDEGTCDEGGKVFNFSGEMPDPASGKTKKTRSTLRIDSPNKHTYEGFTTGPDGKEYKHFEMVCVRKGTS